MAKYSRINYEERKLIYQLKSQGHGVNEIARMLGRSKSSISTELRRLNMNIDRYFYAHAQRDAKFKSKLSKPKSKIQGALKEVVEYLLIELHCSPEQISGYLRTHYPNYEELQISHEAIYRFVYNHPSKHLITSSLRKKHTKRKKKRDKSLVRGGIRNRVSIHQRPKKVLTREEPGHWEGDLIVGKNNRSAIGTLVERTSRFTLVVKVKSKKSKDVVDAFLEALKQIPANLRKSLTYDQGSEMAEHERLTKSNGINVFFADPGSPWQRGTNENTNGLLREFFPKGTDLSLVEENKIINAQELMNKRPRKILNFSSPSEFLWALSKTL